MLVSRWHEVRGNHREALVAIRRRMYHWAAGPFALAPMLRQEGRVAALARDRAGAIRAYRHYLLLRSNPEPVFRAQVDSVKAELARLQ